MKQEIRDYLVSMAEHLKSQPLILSKRSIDGRINSSFNEAEVLNRLLNKFSLDVPNAREWYDFSFSFNGEFVPVNIKISTTDTNDNLNCKLGIYYCLTGQLPPFGNGIDWDSYFTCLNENMQKNSKDYYFLIINKTNTQDIFIASLKTLAELTPNGNNLPFQAKWSKNKIPNDRTYQEAKDFILSNFAKSIKARDNAFNKFRQLFSGYYQNA